jgi:dUTP pyrophosphatase
MYSESVAILQYVKLTKMLYLPRRKSTRAVGFDLKSAYDVMISAEGKELIKTDLELKLPEGYSGRIAPRSGLALHSHINVIASDVYEDHRGNLCIILFNHSDKPFHVSRGDRVAQLIIQKNCYPDLQEVEGLDDTERGKNGFGSTGRN